VNSLEAFLKANWEHLALERFGSPDRVSCVLATPRFRASGHVVFLVLLDALATPVLIGKVPRLRGDDGSLAREAANLRALQSVRACGFDCVPHIVAHQSSPSQPLLLETAVPGSPIRLRAASAAQKIDKVVDWLIGFHRATMRSSQSAWYDRLADQPSKRFLALLPGDSAERQLIERTASIAGVLRDQAVPLVFEHADFCPPNILVRPDGAIGIVDWELAEPDGLPALDLFFFLAAAAFARDAASTETDYLTSFRRAFFGRSAWAAPYISRYARSIGLPPSLLGPLFVLCWGRYVMTLAGRLHDVDAGLLAPDTIEWIRSNRYYALWTYAVTHYDHLNLCEVSTRDRTRVA
jgi:aminoglycoside phosphotransferase